MKPSTNKSKAQASVEYLMIIGVALVIIVPSFYIFFQNSQRSVDQAVASQVTRVGEEIIDTAADVYAYGRNAKLTAEFSMPPNVQDVYLVNGGPGDQYPARELIFEVLVLGTPTNFVFFSDYPLVIGGCSDPQESFSEGFTAQGRKNLQVVSCGRNVSLQFS